jgi:hypothetical protein
MAYQLNCFNLWRKNHTSPGASSDGVAWHPAVMSACMFWRAVGVAEVRKSGESDSSGHRLLRRLRIAVFDLAIEVADGSSTKSHV